MTAAETFPVSRSLAAFASGLTVAGMTPGARRQVRTSLADQVGVIMAAARLGADSRAFVDLALASGGQGATVLGHRRQVAPAFAALANGALAHALDFEDTHDATLVHPSAAVVPAVLAVAEARGATGADVMAALCAGTEIACRIGQSFVGNPQQDTSFYIIPLIGAFGAAAGAGRILGLYAAQMEQAFALALAQVVNSAAVLTDPASSIREVRDGFNAKAGVLAAELAARGVSGFAAPFESPHGYYALFAQGRFRPEVFADLGQRFEAESVSYKPWPACRGAHSFIDIALDLMSTHAITSADIAAVEVGVSPFFAQLCEPADLRRNPPNAATAKFSIPFAVATALAKSTIGLDSFDAAARADAAVRDLAGRVTHRVIDLPQDRSTGGTLTLVLRDGRRFEGRRDQPPGHPDRPLAPGLLRAKFTTCAALAPVPPASDAITAALAAIDRLDQIDNIATDLIALL